MIACATSALYALKPIPCLVLVSFRALESGTNTEAIKEELHFELPLHHFNPGIACLVYLNSTQGDLLES